MKVLVIGGAGYIGSHCVRQLQLGGHRPVVLDSLVFGHRQAVSPETPFYEGELGNSTLTAEIFEKEKIEIVMHFAAFAYVGESVEDPLKYYRNNVVQPLSLIEVMLESGVKKFIFSSSCATYGVPQKLPITEDMPQEPINPYGQTKLIFENLLKAVADAHGFSFASLRYFNAAGAADDGSIGEDHDPDGFCAISRRCGRLTRCRGIGFPNRVRFGPCWSRHRAPGDRRIAGTTLPREPDGRLRFPPPRLLRALM